MEEHPFRAIDRKWQQFWEENLTFRAVESSSRPKYYTLNMFPYPSASTLHMGHVRTYSIGDILARYMRLKGHNVLNPMGWDAFGLPAETPAIREGVHPADWTEKNIRIMRGQLKEMGIAYDWDREISTCDPEYYRWTQWIFLRMFERGLAYRKSGSQNWCAKCQTVLANEEAEGGVCWRCQSPVTKKDLDQWFLSMTAYADRLLEGLKTLEQWPERVKTMQANWIGRSEGARIIFKEKESGVEMPVFTTRPDTLFGVTFLVIAPEHKLVAELVKGSGEAGEVGEYIKKAQAMSEIERAGTEREKTGVLTGRKAVNPANGEEVPILVADYVLLEYGSGIVMGVPAHDQRDFEFAKKIGLPVRRVIVPAGGREISGEMSEAYVEDGIQVNSGAFNGIPNQEAMEAIVRHLAAKNLAEKTVNYRIRDWLVSRQRYWGAPIPMVHCPVCGVVPVPDSELPVLLPREVDFTPGAISPLARVDDFVNTDCPKCKGPARRETDTMATFMDSSWYFLRYCSPRETKGPFDGKAVKRWMPVDQYVGGVEHAVLHLLYARFFQMVLYDLGLVPCAEPFASLFLHGMVLTEGQVISKSKGNAVVADKIIAKYGCDTVRAYLMFAGPPAGDVDWSESGIEGIARFLRRVERLVHANREALVQYPYRADESRPAGNTTEKAMLRTTHQAVIRVTRNMERDPEKGFQFNTAVSALMELTNSLAGFAPDGDAGRETLCYAIKRLILMLSPFAPHLAEEFWEYSGEKPSIFEASWPKADASMAREDTLEIPVQINGRLRGTVTIARGIPETDLKKMILKDSKIAKFLEGKQVRKWIMVPEKLVNLVL